ncbi:hypothetical protein [Undibacterium umbellatum]|jgi:hypothetical protein|uniref:Uncharacterized protein n=1 Tax=Undibacterium umbellatum TaxID=2762300 RepID=A0ABR6Z723_9BURK|nr:hypothetical protein [Undibacterium umbellatum]MBC3907126.1 hypothetical protein [Undibacterium umbellatum]
MNTAFLQVVKDRQLAHELRQIADDFETIDFFQQYGSCCFAMSAMLTQLLTEKGYRARVQGCYAEIKQDNNIFYVGYKGYVQDKQKEGHAVCIVEEQYLIDFGLGALRKFHDKDFSHALACEISGFNTVLGDLDLDSGANISWRIDWISPMVELELQAQVVAVERILNDYYDFQKNRMAYLIKKLFVSKNDAPPDATLAIFKAMRENKMCDIELLELVE